MDEVKKTRAQLLEELATLRREVAELKGRQGNLLHRRDASESVDARRAMAESEARYRVLMESAADSIFALTRDGFFAAANPAAARAMGTTPEVLVGKSLHEVFPPPTAERHAAVVRLVFDTGKPIVADEAEEPTAQGPRWFNTTLVPVRDEHGKTLSVLGIARDVTDRRQAEEALRASEARYRAVVDLQTELICRFQVGSVLTFVNEPYCRYFGRPSTDFVGRSFLSLIPESDRPAVAERLSAIGPARPIMEHEHQVLLPSGEARWMHWVNRGIFDHQGRPVEYQAVGWDITDRKRVEEALRESEARYRAVVEDQTDLVCRFVTDGTLTFVNEAVCRFVGKGRKDLIGSSFLRYLAEERQAVLLARLSGLTPGQPFFDDEEQETMLPSGERRWMHWTNRGIFDGQGRLIEVQGVGRDVTDGKRAEEALRQSEENFRNLFEQSLDGIVVVVDDRVVSANQAFADIHCMPLSEVTGKEATAFMHPGDRVVGLERVRAAARGETLVPVERPWLDLRPDGSTVLVEARSRGVRWAGRPAALVILRDIGERVRLEEELREAQKMEAVGQLAGGIAHDFNNLVTGILGHTDLLKRNAESPADVKEAAGVIEGAARRAAQLTSDLLGFARRGKHQNAPVDLNASVRACINLFSRSLDPRTRVATQFGTDHAVVSGDPVQMEQVVLNLALNARDAMPDGGEMTFRTDVVDVAEEDCVQRTYARPGRYVVLSVKDTGRGVPAELRSRIFEPFFTTKPRGKGTGMGLAMVYGIAKNHGGWAELESEVGRGATFRVFIPQAADVAPEPAAPPAAETPREARGHILVVDDEELVRNAVCRMLAGLGYATLAAADGREAVELYRKSGGEIRLVVIDMIMPQMNGRQCFRALRQLDPQVKVILSTGGADDGAVQDILDSGGADFVQKPYEMRQLAEAIRRALAD